LVKGSPAGKILAGLPFILLTLIWLITGCDGEATPTPASSAIAGITESPTITVLAETARAVTGEAPTGTTVAQPAQTRTAAATAAPADPDATYQQFLPAANSAGPTTTPTPSATFTPLPTPTPTIDFGQVRANLQAGGEELGFVKIGFHVGPGGNRNGLGVWMNRLDEAGVPFFIKSVDDSGALVEAQNILANSDVPHTLVYRKSGDAYDTPDYNLPPRDAAAQHWALHMAAWPPELDPARVWLETINEVDKTRAAWLAEFALATAELALRDGFRWAAFGWASGEPEAVDWQAPAMLSFLRLAAANPDRLAIALHEYSYITDDIAHEYPFKVGRFQTLFAICDAQGIPRPTVLITEWGWEYQRVPDIDKALQDIAWAAQLYAPYPEIRGAAIWYLGPGYNNIAGAAQRLINPVTEYALGNYFPIPLPPAQAPIVPENYRP
jgi:hypothetical protein